MANNYILTKLKVLLLGLPDITGYIKRHIMCLQVLYSVVVSRRTVPHIALQGTLSFGLAFLTKSVFFNFLCYRGIVLISINCVRLVTIEPYKITKPCTPMISRATILNYHALPLLHFLFNYEYKLKYEGLKKSVIAHNLRSHAFLIR